VWLEAGPNGREMQYTSKRKFRERSFPRVFVLNARVEFWFGVFIIATTTTALCTTVWVGHTMGTIVVMCVPSVHCDFVKLT